MFRVRHKDAMGRICDLSLLDVKVETPCLAPVLDRGVSQELLDYMYEEVKLRVFVITEPLKLKIPGEALIVNLYGKPLSLRNEVLAVTPEKLKGSNQERPVEVILNKPLNGDGDIYGLSVKDLEKSIEIRLGFNIAKPVHALDVYCKEHIPLLVAFGYDILSPLPLSDWATEGLYLAGYKLKSIQKLVELPCSCPVCSEVSLETLERMDEKALYDFLFKHNLWMFMEELKVSKQAVREGSLLNLVQREVRANRNLLSLYRRLMGRFGGVIEVFDPVTKGSAFFYSGVESFYRPEAIRARERLKKRVRFAGEKLKPVFGPVPEGLMVTYPFGQSEFPENIEKEVLELTRKEFYGLKQKKYLKRDWSDLDVVRVVADYQFGSGVGEKLFNEEVLVERSKRTGRIRRVHKGGKVVGTLRASDGLLVLKGEAVKVLHKILPYPRYRVVIADEAVDFVKKGRSVFCKFVIECDENIRAGDEVLIVDKNDELAAYGKAVLSGVEMKMFKEGVAVKTRKLA